MRKPFIYTALAVLLLVTGFLTTSLYPVQLHADLRSNASAWLAAYGTVTADLPRVQRVQSIFKKIKRVARGTNLRARLYIVNSENEPWAVALQDGNVILSRGALDIIYDGQNLSASDARMAYVLGHELAHIVSNDFWHQEVYQGFVGRNTTPQERRREQELRADEEGFIFASLAGYATHEIFATSEQDEDFLVNWSRQTSTLTGDRYHSAARRTQFLKNRLAELEDALQLFKYGVKLAHFGRYEDARILLDEFYKTYPSTQVLSNLGYVYIQLARKKMHPAQAYRFWYPTLLEYSSGIPTDSRSLDTRISEAARADLLTAVELLEAGTALDNTDIVGRINLIAAYLYLEDYTAAQAILSEALRGQQGNKQLNVIKALIALLEGTQDRWGTETRRNLEKLASGDDADDNTVYNYARLLTERGRHGKAAIYWKRLANQLASLPIPYQYMTCRQVEPYPGCEFSADTAENTDVPPDPSIDKLWALPVQHGDDIATARSRTALAAWETVIKQNLGEFEVQIQVHPNGDSLLAIDGIVELATIRQHDMPFKRQLQQRFGTPSVDMPVGSGQIWSYGSGWSVLIRDELVDEIWIAR